MKAKPIPAGRNPWPYALLGVFAVFITWIAMFITFAVGQNMDLVRTDYYEEELRYQQQYDRLLRSEAIRNQVSIQTDPSGLRLGLTLPTDHAHSGLTGHIHFYRPSDASLDHEIPLHVGPDGTQQVDVSTLQRGLWQVHLFWAVDGQEYYSQHKMVLPRRKS